MKKKLKLILAIGILIGMLSSAAMYFSNKHIINKSTPYIYSSITEVPTNKTALVLGTAKYSVSGGINKYFKYRMDAAITLFKAGKIKKIIVSGDNHTKSYDEPNDMREWLIEAGIPDTCIHLDYAGFRTFDSVIRAKEIFGQTKFTIVSQPFHNERAVFLARKNGIEAIGYNAQTVTNSYGLKTRIREKFARVKAILDVYILNTKPKFLGEKVEI